jgi:putative membrane protein
MIRLFAALAVGFLGALLTGLAPSPAVAGPGDDPPPSPLVLPSTAISTKIDDADRVFLEKVRQAGLWEIPAGRWAEQKGVSARVKEVGKLIANDHVVLDSDVRAVAARLGVPLPNDPTPQQQSFLAELKAASGPQFDDVFANRLRYAHGAVYAAIAQERAGTRNELMRAFAKQCEIFVHRHMVLLESTGDVKYNNLPPAVVARGNLRQLQKKQPLMLAGLLVVAGAIGVAGVTRVIRGAV